MAFNLPLPSITDITIPAQMKLLNALQQQRAQTEYTNALMQGKNIENQYIGPKSEADIATSKFKRDNPLLSLPGPAGQIGAQMYLRGNKGNNAINQSNENPNPLNNDDYANQIQNAMNATNSQKNARANLDVSRNRNYDWAQLPVETRNNLVAQGIGMGIDPLKFKDYVNQGLSLKQIAEKEGLDPDNLPSPVYFPTSTTKTRVQQQQQVGNELNYLSSVISQAIKPFASTFFGKSPKAISYMLSSDPKKQKEFGEYIGALALQTELAGNRIVLSGAKSGIEMVRDLKNKSLAGIDQISPIKMTPTAYDAAQKYMDKILQKGSKIRNLTGMSPFSQNPSSQEEPENKMTINGTEYHQIGGQWLPVIG